MKPDTVPTVLQRLYDPTVAIALVSTLLLLRFDVSSTWLVLAGAAAGLVCERLGLVTFAR